MVRYSSNVVDTFKLFSCVDISLVNIKINIKYLNFSTF